MTSAPGLGGATVPGVVVGKHHESGRIVRVVLSRRSFVTATVIIAAGAGQGELGRRITGGAAPIAQATSPTSSSSGPVLAADNAAVPFERSAVQALGKDGTGNLNVASTSLERPPAGKLYAPLEVLVRSSPFGFRIDPFTGLPGEFHWGQDFAAPCGTLVYAADAGVVRAVGWHPWGGGNRVEIDHGNGLVTTYNHLQGIAVVNRQPIRVGQVIAKVGTTGSSTGCHLHFETHLNGVYTNPMNWTFLPTKQVDPLGDIRMVSYQPGSGTAPSPGSVWSVPGAVPTDPGTAPPTQTVTGGVQEGKVPAQPSTSPPASPSATQSPTGAPTRTRTATPTGTASPTPTPTGTGSGSPTPTPTGTGSGSPTPTPTRTGAGSPTPTPTLTPTGAGSPTPTLTPTGAGSPTPTPTRTGSPTPTLTPSGSPTPTSTPTPSPTPGNTNAPS